jgi:hypothetical protein|tara:strand:+ start:1059 stop:1421 length:363 start_codon:yes stop_codon:yes gene_type:complete
MADSVSIDEAVGYGVDFLRGIAKYLIIIIALDVVSIILIVWLGHPGRVFGLVYLVIGVTGLIVTFIIGLALSIGVGYKLWVDVLIRSRRKEEDSVPPAGYRRIPRAAQTAATEDSSEWEL